MNPPVRRSIDEDITRARDALDAMDDALDKAHDALNRIDATHNTTDDEDQE